MNKQEKAGPILDLPLNGYAEAEQHRLTEEGENKAYPPGTKIAIRHLISAKDFDEVASVKNPALDKMFPSELLADLAPAQRLMVNSIIKDLNMSILATLIKKGIMKLSIVRNIDNRDEIVVCVQMNVPTIAPTESGMKIEL